jgi:trigger factor
MQLTVSTEPRADRQVAVAIQVPKDRVERELKKAANKAAQQYAIPGFRRGKAPYQVIVRFVGEENLYNEFADKLLQEVYKQALEQATIKPYAEGKLEKIDIEPTLTYNIVVPLEPVIALGDYRGLRITEEEPAIDEAALEERMDQLRADHADWVEVTRPCAFGDTLTLDIHSQIVEENGEPGATVFNETDWDATLDEENPLEPPGLDRELLGLAPGDSKEFDITYPADSKSVNAGKTAHFNVSIKKISAYEKPEWTDELAQKINPEIQSVAELREKLRQEMVERAKTSADDDLLNNAL